MHAMSSDRRVVHGAEYCEAAAHAMELDEWPGQAACGCCGWGGSGELDGCRAGPAAIPRLPPGHLPGPVWLSFPGVYCTSKCTSTTIPALSRGLAGSVGLLPNSVTHA